MKKEELELGMVFTFGQRTDIEYVIICLGKDSATMEAITMRSDSSNRHGCGFGWFENSTTKFIRKMDANELACYQMNDPICNLENGIYIALQNIDTLLLQPSISENEIIHVQSVQWEDAANYQGKYHKMNVVFRQFGKEGSDRLIFGNEHKMACIHWFWTNFKRININR
ncbi:hypothetical protein [Dysgonomonas sp. ZJ709]|uniref:hypothetical protein n=1 Tax=Dysgonomonas sp. ZJ709 TaxID=2709797 RepID=UPI0013EB2AA3|nr:hypothetical protein [Dysgonomonas sp. ZJ709]